MIRAGFVALLSLLLPFSVFGQSVGWSTGVIYEYDGSGNVKKIGTDTYVYDTAQRLIRGSVAGSQQSYTYDSFGNRKACQSAGGGDCQYGFTVDSGTNRIKGRAYDKRGNMLQLPEGNTLEYDEIGMVRKENGEGRQVYYIYTADDERIAVYEANTQLGTHQWEWTVRGLDKKPLREFTSESSSGTTSFRWSKDHIWRDSVLLASRQADAGAPGGVSTYHYHVDHLGTPRQVTNSASVIIGRHDYLPFGPELASTTTNEPKLQDLKFTGHERDQTRDRPPLDYMHARYYEPRLGRFLSVDPTWESADLGKPQSWNRYSYVLNNPVNLTDPDGKCGICLDLLDGDTPLFERGYDPKVSDNPPRTQAELDQRVREGRAVQVKADRPYQRPSGATTPQQRASVQDKPCEVCGKDDGGKRIAGHKKALVQEHYETGTIDKQKMKSLDAVRPECPTCSAKEGADMSRYSRKMKNALKKFWKKLL